MKDVDAKDQAIATERFVDIAIKNFSGILLICYSDDNGGSVTIESGRIFTCQEWTAYLVEQLRVGAWKVIN